MISTCDKPDCEFRPLEVFTSVIGDPYLKVEDFMFMGTAQCGPVTVSLFKHCDTRRYLNLDNAGHAYRYEGLTRTYQPYRSAIDAVRWVLS